MQNALPLPQPFSGRLFMVGFGCERLPGEEIFAGDHHANGRGERHEREGAM